MAEASPKRAVVGRVTAAFGLAWIFWAFFGEVIGLQLGRTLLSLPILPGIALLFIGRAISRGSRVRPGSGPEAEPPGRPLGTQTRRRPVETTPRSSSPRPRPSPPPVRPEPMTPEPETEAMAAFEGIAEEIAEALEGTTVRKTSAEMIAEARERFGRRP